ncbi:hypothetical protein GCM10015535_46710 [Streptomyces gelaticus]|uniref:Uncharacterized protein n=1 Tax=Streptomyces gelaticus TaxID=285446 RepID=A0ABQ2W3M0_9ACTN|nr:hypothetical protein GCM10015535_46710 [Streptomyces gelaticus]
MKSARADTGGGDPVELSPAEPGTDIAAHGPDGRRALGVGPDTGDAPVRDAASANRENSATGRTAEGRCAPHTIVGR